MESSPRVTELLERVPATVPFVAPDAIERARGHALRLRLGANESAFGTSPLAAQAMRAAVEHLAWYADPESYALRSALASLHGVPLENVAVGSGIDDLLGLAVRAFVDGSRRVVASLGSYPTFAYHVTGYGGILRTVPYRGTGHNDLDALSALAYRENAAMVYLANPDNPTGTWVSAADVAAFAAALPRRCLLVLDEAYVEFAPPGEGLPVVADDPRVIRMRTFSKVHGMAGARIGYALAARSVVQAFDKIRLHFGVNGVAQAGALASLGDVAFTSGVAAEVDTGRRDYAALAAGLGLATLPSATNFVAIDCGSREVAQAMRTTLLDRGVFVRMPNASPIDRCIRVTVGTAPERREFAEVFREVWSGGRFAESVARGERR